MKRLLIVRLSALGDIVHALPVLAAVRRKWPGAKVDWLVEEGYAPILALAAGLNRRVVVRARHAHEQPNSISFAGAAGYWRAILYLRSQQYDAALDLQGLIKSALWARLSGAARVIGFDREHLREAQAGALYTETASPGHAVHVIEKNLSILRPLGDASQLVEMPLQPSAATATLDAIRDAGGPYSYIVMNPGAAWPNKRWPAESFGVLAASLKEQSGLSTLVTWGPDERSLAETVARASSGSAQVAPPTEVADLAVLMRDAALVISGDTGPLHIAAAMGTPIVGLYGPTWPERNGPWDPSDETISRASVCVCHHKRRCLRGSPCIETITLQEVLLAAERRLARARPA